MNVWDEIADRDCELHVVMMALPTKGEPSLPAEPLLPKRLEPYADSGRLARGAMCGSAER